ncbi:MAG: bifunctional hydroxymethylpyrimidine kinase/phosphomethylpyrimidine kinase [Rhizomicrobium sp.]
MRERPTRLLVIAGSDSSGGAGIQADIKTATALGAYAMTAITAVTAQDTSGIHAIHPVPAAIVREQIAWTLADIGADAIKIGMLGSADIVEAVADVLMVRAKNIPLVLDPVMASTSGTPLLDEAAIAAMKARLFPLATVVTPNLPEAEILADIPIHTRDDAARAAEILRAGGAKAVLVKGGHTEEIEISDLLYDASGSHRFESPRIDTRHTHGTGCTLATAIAVGLGQDLALRDAVERARRFVYDAIETAPGFGAGHGPLNHMHAIPPYRLKSAFGD